VEPYWKYFALLEEYCDLLNSYSGLNYEQVKEDFSGIRKAYAKWLETYLRYFYSLMTV